MQNKILLLVKQEKKGRMAEVSPNIIKKTQDLLGKYVKKPPLSDKLLKKPPFRFLHDVINVVRTVHN